MNLLASALSLLVLVPSARLSADEVRLRDGRVLYGKVTDEKDALAIATRDGLVRVAITDVVERTTEQSLRDRLRSLEKSQGNKDSDSPFTQLQLALQAHAFALEPEMWRHLDAVLAAPPADRERLQRRIDDFLSRLEPELLLRKYRTADTEIRVRELLKGHRKNDGLGKQKARIALLALEPNADKDLRTEARRNSDRDRRQIALQALLRRETGGNDAFAWRTAILDQDQSVRTAAMVMSRDLGFARGAVDYLAPGLEHASAEVRVRTAEAYEALGDAAAVRALALAGPKVGAGLAAAGSGSSQPRAHVAFLQSQAYVRDFDVEVASGSFIADPKIDVLHSGSVLDVTVQGVNIERVRITRAYRAALSKLASNDPGPDPSTWPAWLSSLPAEPVLNPTTPARTGKDAQPTKPDGSKQKR